jgi:hypothetical protein
MPELALIGAFVGPGSTESRCMPWGNNSDATAAVHSVSASLDRP